MRPRLVSTLSLLMLCATPLIFMAVVLDRCQSGIRDFQASTMERARLERERRPARVRALYALMDAEPAYAQLAYSGSAWMCDRYHVRLRRDAEGHRVLEMDWRAENTAFLIFDELPTAQGKRVTLALTDLDGDGAPDLVAGPRFHASEEEPILSVFSDEARRPEGALIAEVEDLWGVGVDGLIERYLPGESGSR